MKLNWSPANPMIQAKKHPAIDPVERGIDGFSRALKKDPSDGDCPEADGSHERK
jgi:hypothetical protein